MSEAVWPGRVSVRELVASLVRRLRPVPVSAPVAPWVPIAPEQGQAHLREARDRWESGDGTVHDLDWSGDAVFRGHTGRAEDARHDNNMRAGFALEAVMSYSLEVKGTEPDTVIGDLLGDVMHLCDAVGVDFDEQLRQARTHHGCEQEGTL